MVPGGGDVARDLVTAWTTGDKGGSGLPVEEVGSAHCGLCGERGAEGKRG